MTTAHQITLTGPVQFLSGTLRCTLCCHKLRDHEENGCGHTFFCNEAVQRCPCTESVHRTGGERVEFSAAAFIENDPTTNAHVFGPMLHDLARSNDRIADAMEGIALVLATLADSKREVKP
jgi:hypothetical protein